MSSLSAAAPSTGSLVSSTRSCLRVDSAWKRRSRILWFAAALGAIGNGCKLVQLREESRAFYRATVMVGRVIPPSGWQGPVVVAAVTESAGKQSPAHRVLLHEAGGFELIVPDGNHTVHAFGDTNHNGRPDDGEPVATLAAPIVVAGNGMIFLPDLTLAVGNAAALRAALPRPSLAAKTSSPVHSTQAGAVADLASPAFSSVAGVQGYWAPMEAFHRYGGNVYFLEPYDPARIPVLFVHGAAGSAQDWQSFFSTLDRRRYQAWFFQYPSGASLDSMSHLLYWKLLNLQLRYRYERLQLVAHSMGGLVVRRFLVNHGEQFPQLRSFVTISTPWGGEASAALGVEHSPAVIPSWRDMQPEGVFLKTLFERPLPSHVEHTLLFGHRGGYSLLRPTTDGTVTLASQLRPEAQSAARLVMGFDEDHTSILAAPPVLRQVSAALDAGSQAGPVSVGGRVQVTLDYDDPGSSLGGGVAVIALSPLAIDAAEGETSPLLFPFTGNDLTPPLGPLPPGRYRLRIAAPSFLAQPVAQDITIRPGEVTPLSLRLRPQGVLAGFVGDDSDALAQPAGSFRPPHPTLRLQKVVLAGPDRVRTLIPRNDGSPGVLDAHLDGRDDAEGPWFNFMNLPEGDYTLRIHAHGRVPHESRHRVTPGQATPLGPIVLAPLK